MFSTSSQLKYWTFPNPAELQRLREEAHDNYLSNIKTKQEFLTKEEETLIRIHFEHVLLDFCERFQPTLPKAVMGTSMSYLKRFYLHTSVMDYHPKYIYLVCVFLACKVEEFNISVQQFVQNCDSTDAENIVLMLELPLMLQLHYHLTVHNPYRPLEGFIIDIKTSCSYASSIEKIHANAEKFVDRSLLTDSCFHFAPSQIALAALLSAASKVNVPLDRYIAEHVVGSQGQQQLLVVMDNIKRIRYMQKSVTTPNASAIQHLKEKLDRCHNKLNDPAYMMAIPEDAEDSREGKRLHRKRKQSHKPS